MVLLNAFEEQIVNLDKMGVLDTVKQVVFIVDTSSALSGLFNMLVGNYLVPYVE